MKKSSSLSQFVTNDQVLSAEILWALKTVMGHLSGNASSNTDKVFSTMFPDSAIAREFHCGKTKCSYLIRFGLAAYFKRDVLSKVMDTGNVYVVSFDESLNKILQEEQMDLLLRFWDNERDRVVTRYFDSVFLGHTRSVDLLKKFKIGLSKLTSSKLLQVSMDGPSTNWKFYESLLQVRKEHDPDLPTLINVGSCGLHVLHGAFQFGCTQSGWKLDSLLRSLYYCFSDSPARREDYISSSGVNAEFPIKFGATRWVDDVPVAERELKVCPAVKNYVNGIQKLSKSKQPTCQSFVNLTSHVQDVLAPAKLQFFINVAKQLKPFLERYQTDKPMMPFIAEDLQGVFVSVLSRFVKRSVLDAITSQQALAKLDVQKKENIVSPPEKVEIGFAAKQALEIAKKEKHGQVSVSQRQLYESFQGCIAFLRGVAEKIQERSPWKYSFVRALQALDPSFLIANPDRAIEKFGVLLQKLLEAKWMSPEQCDTISQQFRFWIGEMKKYNANSFEEFEQTVTENRLDKLYCELLSKKQAYKHLWKTFKMLLILSHRQSAVERGFSTNKDMLATNLGKEGLAALRTVHDGVKNIYEVKNEENKKMGIKKEVNDVTAVPITKTMLETCRGSRTRYQNFVEEQTKQKKTAAKDAKKSELLNDLSKLRAGKRKLEISIESLENEANDLAIQAELKMKLTILSKSNALRSKAAEQKNDIEDLDKKMLSVNKKVEAL